MGIPKTVYDYKNLATQHGGEYKSDIIPKNTHEDTDEWYCNKCKSNVNTSYQTVLRYKELPCHYKLKKKIIKDYYDIAKIKNGEYILNYIPKNTNIVIKGWRCHNGHIWKTCYTYVQSGRWCPYCINHVPRVLQDYISLADEIGWTYVFKEIPPNINTPTKGWCCGKGHTINASYTNICSNETRCPYCYGNARKELSDYLTIGQDRDIKYVLDYIPDNTDTRVKAWMCPKNHLYESSYGNIRDNETVCPECPKSAKSKYEMRIMQLLDTVEDLKYIMEYKFEKLDYRYDFYVEYKNIKNLLELDGSQHFEFVSYFHATEEYYQRRRNDDINKTRDAKDRNIKLTRLDYKYLDKTKDDELLKFIILSFESSNQFITSNDLMYKWIIDAVYSQKPKLKIKSNVMQDENLDNTANPILQTILNILILPPTSISQLTNIISKPKLNVTSKS